MTRSFAMRLMLAIASLYTGAAFIVGPTTSHIMSSMKHFPGLNTIHHDASIPRRSRRGVILGEKAKSSYDVKKSSYEVDSDEDAEQRLGEHDCLEAWSAEDIDTTVNGIGKAGRFDDLIASTNLEGKLNHVPTKRQRTVSTFDIFCNRELKLGAIRAIGFDMDYTLARYQQPEFDKLAFDGAKEKLVKKLGYPEEVLDFEYDHKVCSF